MLKVTIPAMEFWDEKNERFIQTKETTLTLEHSLKSVYKWEAKWHKIFLSREEKTQEEFLDYIRCMTLTQNVDPVIYSYIPADIYRQILEYIEDPMTATTIYEDPNEPKSGKPMSAEEIYFYMASNNMWLEWEKRHLNQLLMLLRVFSEKNKPQKKMGSRATAANYARLNKARRAKHHTKG